MPEQDFSLKEGEAARFRLEWQPGFRDVRIFVDGRLVSGPFDYAQLRAGQRIPLERGHELFVRCDGSDLNVRLDGALLAGSDSYPAGRFRMAYRSIYLVAASYLVFGGVRWLLGSGSSFDLAAVMATVLLFAVLGFLSSRRWMSAMVGAVLLLLGEFASNLYFQIRGSLPPGIMVLVIPAAAAFVVFRGVLALRELKKQPPELPPVAGSPSGSSVRVPLGGT